MDALKMNRMTYLEKLFIVDNLIFKNHKNENL